MHPTHDIDTTRHDTARPLESTRDTEPESFVVSSQPADADTNVEDGADADDTIATERTLLRMGGNGF